MQLDFSRNPHIQHILVQLPGDGREKYYFVATYIPPKLSDESYCTYLENLFSTLEGMVSGKVYLFGDYNLPDITWVPCDNNEISGTFYSNGTSIASRHLENFISLLNASQFNHFRNCKGRILDLIISNDRCCVQVPSSILLPQDNYHPPLCATIPYKPILLLPRDKITRFNFHKADYDLINQELLTELKPIGLIYLVEKPPRSLFTLSMKLFYAQ